MWLWLIRFLFGTILLAPLAIHAVSLAKGGFQCGQ